MYKDEFEDDDVAALEEDELDRFLELAKTKTDRVRHTCVILARTGMRAAELAHMTEDWVRIGEREDDVQVQVRSTDCDCGDCRAKARQMARRMAEDDENPHDDVDAAFETALGRYWTPKSKRGARTIPVKHRDARESLRALFGDGAPDPAVTVGPGGKKRFGVTRQTIWDRVRRVGDELDSEDPVRPHVLRHTYATLAALKGAEAPTIRDTLGHSDISSSQRYIRFAGKQLDDKLDDVWGADA
jgi:integrase